jgi:tetratricopeptide (TPR) repeat protein
MGVSVGVLPDCIFLFILLKLEGGNVQDEPNSAGEGDTIMTPDESSSSFEEQIRTMHGHLAGPYTDYFKLLGLSRTAISKEIEQACARYTALYSQDRIDSLADPDLKNKAMAVADKISRAHEVLSDYDKRAEYEKRGYRELTEEDKPEDDPLDIARDLYRKAKTLYSRQDFNTAIAALEKAIKLDPKKPDHYYLLGLCQSRVPTLKREAEQNFLKAVEMEPWNAEHYAALGLLFYNERLMSRAESYFRKALDREPSHSVAKAKLEEIVGPAKSGMDTVKEGLQKAFPSIFKKKK